MAIKKKAIKKTEKKVTKTSRAEVQPNAKRLDQAEMRKLENLHNDLKSAQTKMKLYDQYVANVRLKIENLKLNMQVAEDEITRVKTEQSDIAKTYAQKGDILQKYGEELKSKYSLTQNGELRYDPMTGALK